MNKLNTTGQNVNDAAQQDAMRCTIHHFCDSPAKISDLNIITRNHQIKKKLAYNFKSFQGYENQGKTKEVLFQTGTWQLNVVCDSEWSLGIKDDIKRQTLNRVRRVGRSVSKLNSHLKVAEL